MNDIDAALEFTDKTCRSGSLAGILAAEVRRLRDDAASTAGKIIKMTIEHDWAIGEAKRLQAENERLRKDAAVSAAIERAAKDLPDGDMLEITVEKDSAMVVLYWGQGGFETMDVDDDNRLAAEINAAIDAARSAKTIPEPAP